MLEVLFGDLMDLPIIQKKRDITRMCCHAASNEIGYPIKKESFGLYACFFPIVGGGKETLLLEEKILTDMHTNGFRYQHMRKLML